MSIFDELSKRVTAELREELRFRSGLAVAALVLFLAAASPAGAQVMAHAVGGGLTLSAGGTASGDYLQYGQRSLYGASGFVDADTSRRFGVEAEGRWLEFHQTEDVHVETYSVGLRYHMDFLKFQPYVKGLVGDGKFNFPFGYAHGNYFVITAGGGVDYHWTRRVHIRVADVEYQDWPQFTFGAMSSVAVSTGLRVSIF
jgi:hypothetical protein